MDKTAKQILAERFENLLWAHLPHDWTIQSIFTDNILYIVITLPHNNTHKIQKQLFHINLLKTQEQNLWGLAKDCAHKIQLEANQC